MSRSPFGINDSPFKALNLSETADSCTFCAKNLARRARWQRFLKHSLVEPAPVSYRRESP